MSRHIILFLLPVFFVSCTNNEHKADASAKKDSIAAQPDTTNPYRNAVIEIAAFENEKPLTGFGYDILIDKIKYIHQSNIPAASGNNGFKTKEFAQKAGEFAAFKIKNNIMPPTISIEELDSLGVLN